MRRLYSLTDAGRKVWDAQSDRVPLDYRRVLGLVGVETDPQHLCARLGWSQAAVEEILKELERARLVKSIGAGSSDDELDFTGPLDLEELRRAAREKR
jgi:hypothetical protein